MNNENDITTVYKNSNEKIKENAIRSNNPQDEPVPVIKPIMLPMSKGNLKIAIMGVIV